MDASRELTPVTTYFENLDGLRFIAFFAVLLSHIVYYIKFPGGPTSDFIRQVISLNFKSGAWGVNFFFVLSGFLITYLLFSEKFTKKRISIGKFYLKRILRIWPAYYLVLIIGFIIYPLVSRAFGHDFHEVVHWFTYVFFVNNFEVINQGPNTAILTLQWSIAVEEQFYVVWPLLMATLVKPRHFFWTFIAIILLSNIFRGYFINESILIYFHTIPCLNDLAVGALLAYFTYFHREKLTAYVNKIPKVANGFIYLSGFAFISLRVPLFQVDAFAFLRYFERFLIGLFSAWIIAEQCFSSQSLFKMHRFRRLTEWGKMTYGLYLFSGVAMTLVEVIMGRFGPETSWSLTLFGIFLCFVINMGLGWLSYHYVEKRFLALKAQIH